MNTTKLNNYINGGLKLTPILNILLNSDKDSYEVLGEYLYNKHNKAKISNRHLKELIDNTNRKNKCLYNHLSIMFTTSLLDLNTMESLYGKGIEHSHFGEGFDDDEDNKVKYISYFITINNREYHIGFDHRGTTIECEDDINTKELIEDIKYLMDKYINIELDDLDETLLKAIWISRWNEDKTALTAVLTPDEAMKMCQDIREKLDKAGYNIIKK